MLSDYRKLASRFFSWYGPSSLWTGDDHLLYTRGFIVEEYRRFYYEDIEALLVQPNRVREVQTFLLVLCCGLAAFPLFYAGSSWRWIAAVPLLLFLGLLLLNGVKGPTCTLRVVTAVSDCPVRTVHRRGRVERLRQALLERTGPVQGEPAPVVDEPVPSDPLRPQRREAGVFHLLCVACMLGTALLALAMLVRPSGLAVGGIGLLILVTLVCSVGALVRQRNSDMPPGLKAWTWGVFGNFFADLSLAYVGFVIAVVGLSETAGVDDVTAFFAELPRANPVVAGLLDFLYYFFFLCAALLGGLGTVLVARYLREDGAGEGTPAEPGAEA